MPVASGATSLLIDSLDPETEYQFSVLAQNKLGTSSFSEVVTVRTLGEASCPSVGCGSSVFLRVINVSSFLPF